MAKIRKLSLGYDPESDILEVSIGTRARAAAEAEYGPITLCRHFTFAPMPGRPLPRFRLKPKV